MVKRKAKRPCVYMLASKRDGVLYVGVTSDLAERVSLHKQEAFDGFTKRHKVHTLVYFEMHETMDEAIRREKQIKKWNRLEDSSHRADESGVARPLEREWRGEREWLGRQGAVGREVGARGLSGVDPRLRGDDGE